MLLVSLIKTFFKSLTMYKNQNETLKIIVKFVSYNIQTYLKYIINEIIKCLPHKD